MRASHSFEYLLLYDSEDFGLGSQAHVPNFIEEESAAVRRVEFALASFMSAGERAFLMSEQFTLDQFLGYRRAVDLDHRPVASAAGQVYQACRQLFPGPVLTRDEHGSIGGGRAHDLLAQGQNGSAVARYPAGSVGFFPQDAVFFLQPGELDCVLYRDEHPVDGERFFEKIEGPHPGGLDGGFDRSMTGNDDDRYLG